MNTHILRGHALFTAVALTVGAAASGTAFFAANRAHTTEYPVSVMPTGPEPGQVEALLGAAGITPERVCAAGIQPSQISTLVNKATEQTTTLWPQYELALEKLSNARLKLAKLEDVIRTGRATASQVQSKTAAVSNVQAAEQAMATLLGTLKSECLAHVPAAAVGFLERIANNEDRSAPVKYQVVDKTSQQWLTLRDALANVRICTAHGEPPAQGCQQAINQANGVTATATATANLNSLPSVNARWNQALGR